MARQKPVLQRLQVFAAHMNMCKCALGQLAISLVLGLIGVYLEAHFSLSDMNPEIWVFSRMMMAQDTF